MALINQVMDSTLGIHIYLLKQKSDALKALKIFQSFVQNHFNTNIKVIQSYFRGEFTPFTMHLIQLGMLHRLAFPHTSHQNGTEEKSAYKM